MTVAPRSASIIVAYGPASTREKSATTMPDSGPVPGRSKNSARSSVLMGGCSSVVCSSQVQADGVDLVAQEADLLRRGLRRRGHVVGDRQVPPGRLAHLVDGDAGVRVREHQLTEPVLALQDAQRRDDDADA